jgi:hypothetical protein
MTTMIRLSLLFSIILLPLPLVAENNTFGGYAERFKGAGDKIPPHCGVEYPSASLEPFSVLWDCNDNFSPKQDIRTELWVTKKGGSRPELLTPFLGFPAGMDINEDILKVETIKDALPLHFRLVATDRAGNLSTATFAVTAQDNSLKTCTLEIVADATDATEDGENGLPEESVRFEDVSVESSSTSESSIKITTKNNTKPAICEIEKICNEDPETFSVSTTLSTVKGKTTATGSVSLAKTVQSGLTGDATFSNLQLQQLDLSGDFTQLTDRTGTVTLSCTK